MNELHEDYYVTRNSIVTHLNGSCACLQSSDAAICGSTFSLQIFLATIFENALTDYGMENILAQLVIDITRYVRTLTSALLDEAVQQKWEEVMGLMTDENVNRDEVYQIAKRLVLFVAALFNEQFCYKIEQEYLPQDTVETFILSLLSKPNDTEAIGLACTLVRNTGASLQENGQLDKNDQLFIDMVIKYLQDLCAETTGRIQEKIRNVITLYGQDWQEEDDFDSEAEEGEETEERETPGRLPSLVIPSSSSSKSKSKSKSASQDAKLAQASIRKLDKQLERGETLLLYEKEDLPRQLKLWLARLSEMVSNLQIQCAAPFLNTIRDAIDEHYAKHTDSHGYPNKAWEKRNIEEFQQWLQSFLLQVEIGNDAFLDQQSQSQSQSQPEEGSSNNPVLQAAEQRANDLMLNQMREAAEQEREERLRIEDQQRAAEEEEARRAAEADAAVKNRPDYVNSELQRVVQGQSLNELMRKCAEEIAPVEKRLKQHLTQVRDWDERICTSAGILESIQHEVQRVSIAHSRTQFKLHAIAQFQAEVDDILVSAEENFKTLTAASPAALEKRDTLPNKAAAAQTALKSLNTELTEIVDALNQIDNVHKPSEPSATVTQTQKQKEIETTVQDVEILLNSYQNCIDWIGTTELSLLKTLEGHEKRYV
eukprot:TRINITY_DN947_c0_g1_i1.p1 TRINITY_DN947_c0_g1~~TRINITY_DN947_c0_g1_i1.p1  ORF type:complete len:654 (+),score=142.48 TRINITY_DN947_c0_g1_i1:84-2045(+)